jgi:hypothetical protein
VPSILSQIGSIIGQEGAGGGASIPATTNIIIGDGAGNGADSGIASANVAGTLTGTTLAAGVTGSSLTSVGTLTGLTMGGTLAMGINAFTSTGTMATGRSTITTTVGNIGQQINIGGNYFKFSTASYGGFVYPTLEMFASDSSTYEGYLIGSLNLLEDAFSTLPAINFNNAGFTNIATIKLESDGSFLYVAPLHSFASPMVLSGSNSNMLAVGPNGQTNPAFVVDTSAVNAPDPSTGVKITCQDPAAGVSMTAISSDANENFNITAKGTGTLALGSPTTITATTASALAVGRNGGTNPALTVNTATASSVTGLQITSAATGAGVAIAATDSGANTAMTINAKGTGTIGIGTVSTGAITLTRATTASAGLTVNGAVTTMNVGASVTGGTLSHTDAASATAATVRHGFTGAADTNLTLSTEAPSVYFNMGQTRQHATGALTLQRDFRVSGSDHSFVGASTLTNHAVLGVDFNTGNSANATITNSSAIFVPTAVLTGTKTNSYALNVTAASGATNNYCTRYAGSAGEIFRVRTDGQIALLATNTPAGTTGARTINQPSGTVNFAAAATSLVVTNSLCTTASIVHAVVRTNDTTATIKNVVPGAGSFTINLGAAATAETSVGFIIIN